jgi:hypothetical protein
MNKCSAAHVPLATVCFPADHRKALPGQGSGDWHVSAQFSSVLYWQCVWLVRLFHPCLSEASKLGCISSKQAEGVRELNSAS